MFDLCILYEYLITYLLSLSQTALNYINSLEQGKMHTAKKLFLSRNCQIIKANVFFTKTEFK